MSVAQPTYLHLLLQQYQPNRSLRLGSQNLLAFIRVWQTCFHLLRTICLEQVTAIRPISQQFQLIQISSKNSSRRLALSMGDGNFRPPTESTPLDRSPKNLLLLITSATPTAVPNLVQIRLRGASGQMGEI